MSSGTTASSKQQAASSKQQAASSKQQAGPSRVLMALPVVIATCLSGMPGTACAQSERPASATVRLMQEATVARSSYEGSKSPSIMLPPHGDRGGYPPNPSPDGPKTPDITLSKFDLNTNNHQATIILSNGLTAVIDASRKTITMGYDGKIQTFSLDDALNKWSHGNKAMASRREKKLLKLLHSKIDNSRLADVNDSGSPGYLVSSRQSGWVPNSRYGHASIVGLPPVIVNATLPDYSCGLQFSCNYVLISHRPWQPDNVRYGFWFQSKRMNPPDPQHPEDFHAWTKWRNAACSRAKSNSVNIVAGTATFAGTWTAAVATSGAGPYAWIASGLALSAEALVIGYNAMLRSHNERICQSKYPGYLKW